MRDIIITVLVFGMLPFILRYPWYGVLAWSWLSYMNPHRLAWGFAYDMPFAQIVAIVLLFSMIVSKEKKSLPANPLVVVWVIFLIWLIICTVFAVYPDLAFPHLIKVLKIQLITFVTLMLMRDFQRVNQLIWVIVFSIGFYSVKGGIFTFMTGGGYHVFGPAGSDIQENNALAVAVLMIVPLMLYMNKFPPKPWVKKIMPYCIFFSLASVIGSQSRGAVLAILAVGGYYWWKSNSKLVTATVFVLLTTLALVFMPQSWHDRVDSISEYQQDSSSMERIRAWQYSIAIANDRLTGGGFSSWSLQNYYQYGIEAQRAFVAHSIYFSVLNDGGWPGLFLFLLILWLMWRQLSGVIKLTRDDPDRVQYNFLARMLQISLVAFLAGGAFLSLSYFDLAWHFMAITITLSHLAKSPHEHIDGVTQTPRVVRRGVRAPARGRRPQVPRET
ncbi:MAG: putative O-glycosylation ligase, exosortase A system-associated [Halioglobus sp.]|nr:putative O-glycosylation ligase, exosortase A system-associated [Halioglobus sp.]